jgi:chemotaxis protein MotB
MKRSDSPPTIVIKKRSAAKELGESTAWKMAYADFMTSMMAFFLVMWLTSIVKHPPKKHVSDFFHLQGIDSRSPGIGGILGGRTITADGPMSQMSAVARVNPPMGAIRPAHVDHLGIYPFRHHATGGTSSAKFLQKIRQKLGSGVSGSLKVSMIPEGVQIDLLAAYKKPMFKRSTPSLSDEAQKHLRLIGRKLRRLPNPIYIVGHTDATHYHEAYYTNWELSADRANAARRLLRRVSPGLNIRGVVGEAARHLYDPQNPSSPTNRRISLVVLKEAPLRRPLPHPGLFTKKTLISKKRSSPKGPKTSPSLGRQDILHDPLLVRVFV